MWQGDHKNGTNDDEEEDNEDDGDGHLWEGDHEDGTEESRGSEQQRNCWTQVLAASVQYCHDDDDCDDDDDLGVRAMLPSLK